MSFSLSFSFGPLLSFAPIFKINNIVICKNIFAQGIRADRYHRLALLVVRSTELLLLPHHTLPALQFVFLRRIFEFFENKNIVTPPLIPPPNHHRDWFSSPPPSPKPILPLCTFIYIPTFTFNSYPYYHKNGIIPKPSQLPPFPPPLKPPKPYKYLFCSIIIDQTNLDKPQKPIVQVEAYLNHLYV